MKPVEVPLELTDILVNTNDVNVLPKEGEETKKRVSLLLTEGESRVRTNQLQERNKVIHNNSMIKCTQLKATCSIQEFHKFQSNHPQHMQILANTPKQVDQVSHVNILKQNKKFFPMQPKHWIKIFFCIIIALLTSEVHGEFVKN